MTPVGINSASAFQPTQAKDAATTQQQAPAAIPVAVDPAQSQQVGQDELAYTENGKQLLASLEEQEKQAEDGIKGEKIEGEKEPSDIQAFTYGALGMDHPEELEQTDDGSYSAGQYLKGALSIGAILLAIA